MIPYLILIENDNVADQGVMCKGLETGHLYCLYISVDPAVKKLRRKTIKVWPMMPRKQTNAGEEVLAVQMFPSFYFLHPTLSDIVLFISYILFCKKLIVLVMTGIYIYIWPLPDVSLCI